MNELITKKIDNNIEGTMHLALLNRVKELDAISNSTYSQLKRQIIVEYKLKIE